MHRLLARLLPALLLAAVALCAHAEKTDREKPVNFAGDDVNVNYDTRTGTLKGNAIITQGTMTVRADRIDFKQNADNSISATVYGNPLSFRQKKDASDEYYEAYAQRAHYDGEKDLLELFDRALLKQGGDEIRSNYLSYNTSTGVFKAEGRPNEAGAAEGPGARVRGTFQPREGESLPGAKPAAKGADEGAAGKSAGKGAAGKGGAGKGATDKGSAGKGAARTEPKGTVAPGKPAAPLTLRPDDAQKP
jgi:lipopolysaccharide export system protein LptA